MNLGIGAEKKPFTLFSGRKFFSVDCSQVVILLVNDI